MGALQWGGLVLMAACAVQSVVAEPAAYRAPTAASPSSVAASLVLADIPAGDFWMGSAEEGYQNGYPRHPVHIAAFRLSRFDTTFDQYDAFANATGRPIPADEGWGGGNRPVINVEWADIQAFIRWLNKGTGRRYRLPSEAEWEYAARAGTMSIYWWGDEPNPDYANTAVNHGHDVWEFTSPVGSFPMNPFGLYDMLGNVWQVVQDCRHLTYEHAPSDGRPWVDGDCDSRVARGGYFASMRVGIRSFTRGAVGEHFRSMGVGFRLAESAK